MWTVLQVTMDQAQCEPATDAATGFTGAAFRIAALANAASSNICIGALGAGLSEGYAAPKAVEGVARNPQPAPTTTRPMNIGQAVANSNTTPRFPQSQKPPYPVFHFETQHNVIPHQVNS
jgi:F-type H+-transporting ATPase subunit c